MKSENQFLLSYLCAETIWKVICCSSNLSSILQHLWKNTQEVKQNGQKEKEEEEKKKNRNLKRHACVTMHFSSKKSGIFFLFGARSIIYLSKDTGYYLLQ